MGSESISEEKISSIMEHGTVHPSIGGSFSFRVIGPCCRLYDREELPWPSCSLAFKRDYGVQRSKNLFWRRIGSRFVPDIAARRCPSYAVEILQPGSKPASRVLTFYSDRFSPLMQEWWYSKSLRSKDPANVLP